MMLSSIRVSVCDDVYCGAQGWCRGWKLYRQVRRVELLMTLHLRTIRRHPHHFLWHFCCRMYRLATKPHRASSLMKTNRFPLWKQELHLLLGRSQLYGIWNSRAACWRWLFQMWKFVWFSLFPDVVLIYLPDGTNISGLIAGEFGGRGRIWNALPEETTSAQSLTSFRQHLKTWLFRQSYPDLIFWSVLHWLFNCVITITFQPWSSSAT